MTYIVEIPVAEGGVLRVEGNLDDISSGLVPAARSAAGPLVSQASQTVESALDDLTPAITATTNRLRALAADEVTVEFGLMLGVEGGVVVAKGSAEVHFTVTLTWKRPEPEKLAEEAPKPNG